MYLNKITDSNQFLFRSIKPCLISCFLIHLQISSSHFSSYSKMDPALTFGSPASFRPRMEATGSSWSESPESGLQNLCCLLVFTGYHPSFWAVFAFDMMVSRLVSVSTTNSDFQEHLLLFIYHSVCHMQVLCNWVDVWKQMRQISKASFWKF